MPLALHSPPRPILLALLTGLLALGGEGGCGKKSAIDGIWHDATGLITFTLYDAAKCDMTVAGRTVSYTYQITGNTVKLTPVAGRNVMTWTIQSDGTLHSQDTGGTITRAK